MPSCADAFVSAGDPGSQRRERWAALSLSKVSTSQYQQGRTMWATWEEEMEFLLVLLRRSQTLRVPSCTSDSLSWDENTPKPCCLFGGKEGRDYGHSAESRERGGGFSDYLKYFQLWCSCSISPDFRVPSFFSVFTHLPPQLQYPRLTAWRRARTNELIPKSALAEPRHRPRLPSAPRTQWGRGGWRDYNHLFKADKCFTKCSYLDIGFIIIFPDGASCQSKVDASRANKHTLCRYFLQVFGVICRAQSSFNLTRSLNIPQARKMRLKAPHYPPPPPPPCKQAKSSRFSFRKTRNHSRF